MVYISNSSEETKTIGKKIAAELNGGDVVLLFGDLGAGKTTIIKGIAEYFGITEDKITSPTFTLMNVYEITRLRPSGLRAGEANLKFKIENLVHIDTYRLENEKELLEIGVEDYIGNESCITFIEWPEKIVNLLKNTRQGLVRTERAKTRQITLKHVDGNKREIIVE